MNTYIGHSLTAAGVTFDIEDFRNPNLDQLTPIQVTKDGRVFGHLAGWKTNHIAYDKPVQPPKSKTGYKYFHQSVVPTTDGDLPVGHLTLGTGHAGSGDAVAAAAHYDNTGSQVAAVRAGDDKFGIWIAGRVHPGTDDMQRQTLRRSSLSGDWRKIDGALELVAALAVNVPGFPIPRTEQLVASAGEPTMLVAAGIVRNGPITRAEIEQMVAAAAEDAQTRVDNEFRRRELTAAAEQTIKLIEADAAERRREALTAAGEELVASFKRSEYLDRFTALVAAGVVDEVAGRMPPELHRYWTSGVGLARWAPTPTPYRSLVTALESEIPDMTPEQIKGLAANLYHDVFKKWPGGQNKDGDELAAAALPPTADEATAILADPATQALLAAAPIPGEAEPVADPEVDETAVVDEAPPVHTGGMVALVPADPTPFAIAGGEAPEELHVTLAFLGEDLTQTTGEWRQDLQAAVAEVAAEFGEMNGANGIEGKVFGRAVLNENSDEREACAVYLVEADGLAHLRERLLAALGNRVPKSDFDTFLPHLTAGYGIDVGELVTAVGTPIQFDRIRVAIAGENTDLTIGEHAQESLIGEVPAELPAEPELDEQAPA